MCWSSPFSIVRGWRASDRQGSRFSEATATVSAGHRRQPTQSILIAATIVAVLDILYAILLYAFVVKVSTPARVFQSIAAGLLGKAAFQGGTPTVTLGGALHLLIACIWTLIYFVMVRRFPSLRDRVRHKSGAITVGLLYGAFVHVMMNLVVIPLSQIHRWPDFDWDFWLNIIQQAVMVGLPIVLIVRDGESA